MVASVLKGLLRSSNGIMSQTQLQLSHRDHVDGQMLQNRLSGMANEFFNLRAYFGFPTPLSLSLIR
jgi:hypothetical protein